MKSISEKPAILTVHPGEPGQYILRVGDLKYRTLVVGITKLLEDARSFVVVTPSDIKVFEVGNEDYTQGPETESTAPESEAQVETQPEIDGELGDAPAEPVETKPVRRRGRPPKEPNSTCGRCRGTGRIQTLVDNGRPADSSCPVCHGSGQVIRYGAR